MIGAKRVREYAHDAMVMAVVPKDVPVVLDMAAEAGIPAEELIPLVRFLEEEKLHDAYRTESLETQLAVIKALRNATDEEIADREWMYRRVIEYGIYCFKRDWFRLDPEIRWDKNGMMQVPEEFTDFCMLLSTLDVGTAIEIGVFRGRSSYFMCAVLMRKNPALQYLLVDIEDRLDGYERFRELLPALQKKIPSTSDDYAGERYDFVFIDADHSYDASMRDYEKVGKHARVLTAFHDIYAHEYDNENGGTVRMWKEVTERTRSRKHRVFSKYPDKWMGIGCILI